MTLRQAAAAAGLTATAVSCYERQRRLEVPLDPEEMEWRLEPSSAAGQKRREQRLLAAGDADRQSVRWGCTRHQPSYCRNWYHST